MQFLPPPCPTQHVFLIASAQHRLIGAVPPKLGQSGCQKQLMWGTLVACISNVSLPPRRYLSLQVPGTRLAEANEASRAGDIGRSAATVDFFAQALDVSRRAGH